MTRKSEKKSCNCEFCIACDVCNHSADSHVAGDGNCMMKGCDCASHHSWVISIWERMSQSQRNDYDSFTQFADRMMEAKNTVVNQLNGSIAFIQFDDSTIH